MSLLAVKFSFNLMPGPKINIFSLPEFDLQYVILKGLCGAFLNPPQLKQPYSNCSVLCQGFPRGGFEGMIHFSKPYQLHPTPPYNNATVCSPRSLDAPRTHPPTHMWDAVVLSCSPTAGASPSPPLHPSAFPPFTPNNASVLSATLCRLFQRTSKKEKQIEAAGDNETAGYAKAVHFGILYFLSHVTL